MSKTKLEEIVDAMPGAQRRFVWKQGEIATQIWRLMSEKTPAWTQRDLARKAKMKESYLSYLLSGVANPTVKTICALEEALGGDIIIAPSPRRAKELAEIAQSRNVQSATNIIPLIVHPRPRPEDDFVTPELTYAFSQFASSGV